jgi:tRNA (guanine10-N2)-dimethyltransferase
MEAARLGYDCCGIELDQRVLEGASKNLMTEKLGDRVKVLQGDSRMLGSISEVAASAPFDCILTDPPFGRSASVGGDMPGDLLRTVLIEARGVLKDGAPVVLDAPEGKMLDGIEGYRLEAVFKLRVHKSLTRHIGVLAAS